MHISDQGTAHIWSSICLRAQLCLWRVDAKYERQTWNGHQWCCRFFEWVRVAEQSSLSLDLELTGQPAMGGKCFQLFIQHFISVHIQFLNFTIEFEFKNLPGALSSHPCRDWSLSLWGRYQVFSPVSKQAFPGDKWGAKVFKPKWMGRPPGHQAACKVPDYPVNGHRH